MFASLLSGGHVTRFSADRTDRILSLSRLCRLRWTVALRDARYGFSQELLFQDRADTWMFLWCGSSARRRGVFIPQRGG